MTAFVYDNTDSGGGRLSEKQLFANLAAYDDGEGTPDQTISYIYDASGRVVEIADSDAGTWSYGYDADGRQIRVTSPQGTVRYEYDNLGRLTRTYSGDADSTHTSAANDDKAVTDTRYGFDELGRLMTVTVVERDDTPLTTPEVTTYGYDADGNLDWTEQSNGITSDYQYDELNRLTELDHFIDTNHDHAFESGETLIAKYHYELDADGNRTQDTETDDQGRTSIFYWGYDAENRLTSEVMDSYDDGQDYIARYAFDLSSNRMSKATDNAATSTAISAFLSSGTFSGDEMIGYEYDANDRLLTEAKDAAGTNDDTFTEYRYGASNALTMQTGKAVYEGLDDTGTLKEQTSYSYNLQGRMAGVEIDSDGDSVADTQMA